MTFGQKIKIRREELGYTQAELAERVHTTQPYVSRLERGWFNFSTTEMRETYVRNRF